MATLGILCKCLEKRVIYLALHLEEFGHQEMHILMKNPNPASPGVHVSLCSQAHGESCGTLTSILTFINEGKINFSPLCILNSSLVTITTTSVFFCTFNVGRGLRLETVGRQLLCRSYRRNPALRAPRDLGWRGDRPASVPGAKGQVFQGYCGLGLA